MYACNDYQRTTLPRRRLLQAGGAGLLGLTMPRLLEAKEKQGAPGKVAIKPRAKSVIFLFQFGGPSHLETFDMKPDAPDGIRGLFSPIRSNVPGIDVCEHLPGMARVMDKVAIVRSMTHSMKNHNSAAYYALSGREPPVDDIRLKDSLELFPAYGSVVDRVAPGTSSEMPTFVAHPYVISDGSRTPGQFASFLGKIHDPLVVTSDPNRRDFRLPELSLPANLSLERLEHRRELQRLIDQQSRLLDTSARVRGIDAYYESALDMLRSPAVARAFDLSQEPEKLRDRYGRTTYGQSCLLARRLVEAGVKFVNVYFASGIGGQSTTDGGWDTHGFNNTRMFPIIQKYHLPITDQVLPTLLEDLDERGLLDETLVVWVGEFGRTPKINGSTSRDHWPSCYTALLAGGGVKRGYVHGASDKNGAYPARDPVKPDDLAATMFYLLGIDPQTEVHDAANRPLTIAAGDPVTGLLA
ncbi:MAG TPA: DUF1501 domain-containing protein [Pirellulales bacterium]|jgi:hypothetical protein|nr:DUF1501 domain-containing protein [Pirellulales bacterium]